MTMIGKCVGFGFGGLLAEVCGRVRVGFRLLFLILNQNSCKDVASAVCILLLCSSGLQVGVNKMELAQTKADDPDPLSSLVAKALDQSWEVVRVALKKQRSKAGKAAKKPLRSIVPCNEEDEIRDLQHFMEEANPLLKMELQSVSADIRKKFLDGVSSSMHSIKGVANGSWECDKDSPCPMFAKACDCFYHAVAQQKVALKETIFKTGRKSFIFKEFKINSICFNCSLSTT